MILGFAMNFQDLIHLLNGLVEKGEIIPKNIKDIPMQNNSLKYGCVIILENTQNKDIYIEIEKHNEHFRI